MAVAGKIEIKAMKLTKHTQKWVNVYLTTFIFFFPQKSWTSNYKRRQEGDKLLTFRQWFEDSLAFDI
jgi:hypothetical protein